MAAPKTANSLSQPVLKVSRHFDTSDGLKSAAFLLKKSEKYDEIRLHKHQNHDERELTTKIFRRIRGEI